MKTIVLIFVSVAALLSAENSFAKESFDKMVPLINDQKDYEGYLKVSVIANFERSNNKNIEEKVFIVPIDKEYIQNAWLYNTPYPAEHYCRYQETFVNPKTQESVKAYVYFAIQPWPIDENAAKGSLTFLVRSEVNEPMKISIASPEDVNVSFYNSNIDGYVYISYHKGDLPEASSIKPNRSTDQLVGVYLSEALKGIADEDSRDGRREILKWHQNQTPGNSLRCAYYVD